MAAHFAERSLEKTPLYESDVGFLLVNMAIATVLTVIELACIYGSSLI